MSQHELFTEAMKEGRAEITNSRLLLQGPPAVGKTSFQHLILGDPPPKLWHSTSIAGRATRAVQSSRTAATGDGTKLDNWSKVSSDELLDIVSEAIPSLIGTTPTYVYQ